LFTRLGCLVAIGMAVNITIGILSVPHEWGWTYVMLIMWPMIFLFTDAGRSFGIDAFLAPRLDAAAAGGSRLGRLLRWLVGTGGAQLIHSASSEPTQLNREEGPPPPPRPSRQIVDGEALMAPVPLAISPAAIAAPAAGRVLARPSTSLAPRIVILGGGFAGVTAAVE